MALGIDQQKRLAATAAAQIVRDGQIVGLGSGTTVIFLLEALAERVRAGLRFVGVPTSDATARLAARWGLSLGRLDEYPRLDLDIDGADEIDPALNLIKGLGGALLREKLVARAAGRFVVVVDERKPVQRLGESARVPVEVIPFGWTQTCAALMRLGAAAELRGPEPPFRTDSGNYILDCRFTDLSDPAPVAAQIKSITGVVEHGLFLGMASEAFIGHADGSVEHLTA